MNKLATPASRLPDVSERLQQRLPGLAVPRPRWCCSGGDGSCATAAPEQRPRESAGS